MNGRNRWFLVLIYLLSFSSLLAQQDREQRLWDAGFEQVHILDRGDTLTVYFEHRLFRSPWHSMRYAERVLDTDKAVTWVPLYHNRPMGAYTGKSLSYRSLRESEHRFFRENNSPSNGYRFQFRIMPDFAARFGNFEQPFSAKTNVILDTRIYLLPGLSVQGGLLIPLQNNLDGQAMNLRLSPSHIHYFRELMPAHWVSLTTGLFLYDRYGLDLQYRYDRLGKPWSIGLEAGFTGFYFLPPGSLYTEALDDLVLVGDLEYRLPLANLTAKLSVGQFLFGDQGARGELIRQFGNFELGFHAAATKAGNAAGFQLAFPLFPGKLIRSKKVELRTTEEFRWEYSYNNEDLVARKYRLGIPRLSDQLRQYKAANISYLR